jgi:parvulin-like peptidyl-prolyl isomerase
MAKKKSGKQKPLPGRRKKRESAFKKIAVSVVIGFVAVAFVGSFAYRYVARTGGGKSIAVVNGEPIARGTDSLFANYYRQFYDDFRKKKGEEAVTEEENRKLFRQALDAAIQRTLILQYAKKKGVRVGRSTVLAEIIRKGYYASPDSQFDEKRYERTPESDRQRIYHMEEQQLLVELFLDDFIRSETVTEVDTRSFYKLTSYGKKIDYVYLRYDDVDEDRLRAFYKENPKLFERAHVAHILIKKDEEYARGIYQRVKADPDSFAKVARVESEDSSAKEGGDLGWFYRDDMAPEFSAAAFALKPGEISKPVKTVFGYHIIKALDPVEIAPFEEAIDRVRKKYVEEFRDQVEKRVAEESKLILDRASSKPESFREIASASNAKVRTTDFITVDGQYILDEGRTVPLFELMGVKGFPEAVFSTKDGAVGGPVKTQDGEIIFRVIGVRGFDENEYQQSRERIANALANLKENYLYNDWYNNALRSSRIVDNFNRLMPSK